ncbi:MAG: hypothetical protein P8Z40_09710, partial [Chloroflexota bacterium]
MKKWGWILGMALLSACTAAVSAESPLPDPADGQPTADEVVEPESAQVEEVESEDSPAPQATTVPLPNLGPAPELQNEVWLNVVAPLRLAVLRGQVVLLDM